MSEDSSMNENTDEPPEFDMNEDVQDGNVRIIDEAMNDHYRHVQGTRHTGIYDKSDIAMIELLEILQKAGAPVYLFDKLTAWCKRSSGVFQN